jgi:hypothetical protein
MNTLASQINDNQKEKAMLEACLEKIETNTETSQEPREAKIKTDLEEMEAVVKTSQEVKAINLEANPETTEAIVERQTVHDARHEHGHYWGFAEPIWEPAFGSKVQPAAEETDPGRWWVPAEVDCSPRMDDPEHRSCTA